MGNEEITNAMCMCRCDNGVHETVMLCSCDSHVMCNMLTQEAILILSCTFRLSLSEKEKGTRMKGGRGLACLVVRKLCYLVFGGVHYGEVEGLVSVERWSCSRGASCVEEYTMGRLRGWSL